MAGDPSIAYQTRRDLQGIDDPALRARIATEGWGKRFLECRNEKGGWGERFYQPKWISTHYTLLDLKNLQIAPDCKPIRESIAKLLAREIASDGGVGPGRTPSLSDVCVNGMFLNYAAYFGAPEAGLQRVVDFLLTQRVADGGFNCRSNRTKVHHSSLHSTLSVAEGIREYLSNGYAYRADELEKAEAACREFMLMHRLYKSDHTGEIIHPEFLMLRYPPRWKYNILRALDYFQVAGHPRDKRMADAIGVLTDRRRGDGRWALQSKIAGKTHFNMETGGRPSRWITLMALRVLKAYGDEAGQV
jgi:hypothetical protein